MKLCPSFGPKLSFSQILKYFYRKKGANANIN